MVLSKIGPPEERLGTRLFEQACKAKRFFAGEVIGLSTAPVRARRWPG
jgi:hypothetical protein